MGLPDRSRSDPFFLPKRRGGAIAIFVHSRFRSERQPYDLA